MFSVLGISDVTPAPATVVGSGVGRGHQRQSGCRMVRCVWAAHVLCVERPALLLLLLPFISMAAISLHYDCSRRHPPRSQG